MSMAKQAHPAAAMTTEAWFLRRMILKCYLT